MLKQLKKIVLSCYNYLTAFAQGYTSYTSNNNCTTRRVSFTNVTKSSFYAFVYAIAQFKRNLILFSSTERAAKDGASALATIRFAPSDLSNLYSHSDSFFFKKDTIAYFLRKHKLFNKGRYSRNRQTYRTGAYWCLWVNIIAVTGFYYWFYRFSMSFGYLWPFFSLFIISFIFPRALKYNYISMLNLTQSVAKLFSWFFLILRSCLENWVLKFLKVSTKHWSSSFNVNYNKDLHKKIYSHWNYFLPLRWIHRAHRKFFYKRVFYICFK